MSPARDEARGSCRAVAVFLGLTVVACGTSGSPSPSSSATGSSSGGSSSGSGGSSASGSSSGSGSSSSGGSSSGGSSSGGSGGSSGSSGGAWSSSAEPAHFHWQLSTPFAPSDLLSGQQGLVVYDIDGEGSTAADVAAIHAAGAKAVCYVDVGSLEQGRSDYAQFPSSVIGPPVAGWPGENWLLVTAANQSVVLPLMKARIANWCQSKGFDAVEPDNLDAWTNISGLSETDNVTYDLAIAGLAHEMALSIGLKNMLTSASPGNVASIVSTFDWALVEQCFEYSECDPYGQFISAGKAVWDVEYNKAPDCVRAGQAHRNAQLRDLNLAGPHASGYMYTPCIPDSQSTW